MRRLKQIAVAFIVVFPAAQLIRPDRVNGSRDTRNFSARSSGSAPAAQLGSQVGGSQDNFFNALDEFACPAVGAIGAAAGVLVASLVK